MKNTIILIGHGKLADSIHNKLLNHLHTYTIDYWENIHNHKKNAVILVHIGSGRQLPEAIEYCKNNKTPLIQGSTGMDIKHTDYDFTFIDAPNMSLLMLKFMHMLKKYGHLYKDYEITITESHQHTKKTVPGTAVEMSHALNVKPKKIKSIRNQDEQVNTYGISKEHLSLHAYHDISIHDKGTTINFTTLVEGHDSYIKGLSKIILCLKNLDNTYYHILDLIEMKLL